MVSKSNRHVSRRLGGSRIMSEIFNFRDATRQQAKASILIEALTGKGKSGLALLLGYYLAGEDWQKVFGVDTENKSLDLFQGIRFSNGIECTPFKKLDLLPAHGYQPTNYLRCKDTAINNGGAVLINDSITHMWQREGGVLELVSQKEKANKSYNKYSAWGDDDVIREKQAIYNVVRDSRIHVISTVRVKEKFDMVTVDGRTQLKSLGEQELQMPDLKYEPDLVLHMLRAGNSNGTTPKALVIKSRYAIFQEGVEYEFTEVLCKQLRDYLAEGVDPAILLEAQRQDLIKGITAILDENTSKRTMFPMLKEQQGQKDVALADLPLRVLQTLIGALLA